jgi:hypothetical protein
MSGGRPWWRLPVQSRGPAQVHAIVAHILAEPQFHPRPSLWQRFVNWLDSLHLHSPGLQASGPSTPWLSDVVLVVLVGAVVTLVVLAFRRGAFSRLRHPRGTGVVVTEEGGMMAPEAWLRQAAQLAAEGRYREALRCRYRALVAELAFRGVVAEVPGRTSGDYERLVGAAVPEVATGFSTITRLFERCWYGHEPSDEQAQSTFDEMAAAILDRVGAVRWRAREPSPEPVGSR